MPGIERYNQPKQPINTSHWEQEPAGAESEHEKLLKQQEAVEREIEQYESLLFPDNSMVITMPEGMNDEEMQELERRYHSAVGELREINEELGIF